MKILESIVDRIIARAKRTPYFHLTGYKPGDQAAPRNLPPAIGVKAGEVTDELRHVLLNLAARCDDVAQRAGDAERFGMDGVQPGQALTNGERLWRDLNYVAAYGETLASLTGQECFSRAAVVATKAEIEAYLRYPYECNSLGPEPGEQG